MKVVLYDVQYNKLYSIVTAIVTGCGISHASFIEDGVNYDTTFSRGYFGKATAVEDFPDRLVTVFDLPDVTAEQFIQQNIGTKYDAVGLCLWLFGIQSKTKYYCFETVLEVLRLNGIKVPQKYKNRVSGKDLIDCLTDLGYVGQRTKIKYILPN